ncbi:MAG: SGNH/GDSL hydrolase family protein [Ramlibacter sp.]|nr:SGNH/GDSL hydrolase family protein [Ramlibacter sp.]
MNGAAGLLAAKFALGPLLLPQSRWLRRKALRLPEAAGPRAGEIGHGAPGLRLLVVGDSSAAGVGVADQAQALALPLAARLADALAVPVAWQLVARTGVNTAEARALVRQSELRPADVVVTALGVNDVSSQTPAGQFIAQTALLWSELQQRSGARWAVLSGLPPMHMLRAVPQPLRWYLGRYAAWLDAAVRDWSGERRLGYCALQWSTDPAVLAEDGFHPGPRLYPQWAQRLAQIIVQARERWVGRA